MKVFVKSGVVIAKGNATDKTPRGEWVVAPAGTKIGDLYRKSDGTFRSPIYTITAKRFWRRWTTAERELLANKLRTGTGAQQDRLNAFLIYVACGEINLDDTYIANQLDWLTTTALVLAAGRATEILGNTA